MKDETKIKKLRDQRRDLVYQYECTLDELENQFAEHLEKIDNQLFDLTKIGYKFKKYENTIKQRSSKNTNTGTRKD